MPSLESEITGCNGGDGLYTIAAMSPSAQDRHDTEPSTAGRQDLPAVLTALDPARAMFFQLLSPVAPRSVPLEAAAGLVGAGSPPLAAGVPASARAARDGWAMRANDLAGASSYSPVLLRKPPVWVDLGEPLPEGCDCVIDAQGVESAGAMFQVLVEAFPGENIRRAGEDLSAGTNLVREGHELDALDILALRSAGAAEVAVRRPRVLVLDIPAVDGTRASADLIAQLARAAGAQVTLARAKDRTQPALLAALDTGQAELVLTIGGTGNGRHDAAVQALASDGTTLAHGLAMHPGRSTALATIQGVPVIALPASPDHALAAWWALVEPGIDRLTARARRREITLALGRKIASQVGMAEVVLLERCGDTLVPIATGDLPLHRLVQATHFCIVPAGSEGHAPGESVTVRSIRPFA
ncbi:MAG: molybdopterin-binding protein [Hyphomicrobiales bacterium]|nr:molybdopterin-binding protein [Hyphomicrobiales bacterium]